MARCSLAAPAAPGGGRTRARCSIWYPGGYQIEQPSVWKLAARQHGVVTRGQLLALGFSARSIKHRIARGRLHPVWRGVYAVGRPQLTIEGRCMAAVLSCGTRAVLSHESAASLWLIRPRSPRRIEISVPSPLTRVRPGIVVHRRAELGASDVTLRGGIPVTSPICTLVDIALRLDTDGLEAAINEADKHDLVDPEELRAAVHRMPPRPGVGRLRELLGAHAFTLTDSELERRFLPLARRAGLPAPVSRCEVDGFKVDFFWPQLGLVVETDGLRYHRTPAQQARDRLRDQVHAAAGLTPLRFTRAQVRFEPAHVEAVLAAVARRLAEAQSPTGTRAG